MTVMKNILVPIDFSSHSRAALECAIGLAKTYGSTIHVLHAYHLPIQIATPDQIVTPQNFWRDVRDAAARKLEKSAELVRRAGVPVETHLTEAQPAAAIIDLADKLEADLIVMGTRGLSGLKHVLLGSVAERTVRLAPCPVLTVKDEGE
jgi:nucleotide-binding universal stress UspA family protein